MREDAASTAGRSVAWKTQTMLAGGEESMALTAAKVLSAEADGVQQKISSARPGDDVRKAYHACLEFNWKIEEAEWAVPCW